MNLEDIRKISEKYKIELLELYENDYDINSYKSSGLYFVYKKDNENPDKFDCSLVLVSKEFNLVLGILYGIQHNDIKLVTKFFDRSLYGNIADSLKEIELYKNKLKEYEDKIREMTNEIREMTNEISKYETENKIISNRVKELEKENKNKIDETVYLKTILTITNTDKITDIIFNK